MFLGEKEVGIYIGDTEMSGVFLGEKESWTSSLPWVAIALDRTLTEPCVAPVGITSGAVYFQSSSGNIYQASGQYGITTKNSDGSFYIPTNKCKYMRVRIGELTSYAYNFIVEGKKKDGTVEIIGKYKTSGGTTLQYVRYKDLTDIEVKGYDSVRVYSEDSKANQVGIGWLEFYN